MGAMLIDNHKQTIMGLLREGETLLQRIADQDGVQRIQSAQHKAETGKELIIMFYGLYNAGKSTLINALCLKHVAPTGDVPTTVSIQEVPWEGYTLIDTPGIDAHTDHTEIAMAEIRRSDIVLFVMDNADTFDNALVYQAIIDILKSGKPLAIVINQKNVDETEDPNIPVPKQKSMQKIIENVSSNLEKQASRNGMAVAGTQDNFLGIFPVDAFTAENAAGEELLYENSGVLSLRNALNDRLRRSEQVYKLRTPLIELRDTIRQAMKTYQESSIYGEKQQLAEARESLIASRQRLKDRLLSDGLRKIEAVIERMKAAAANGQMLDNAGEELNRELNALIQSVAAEEQAVLQSEINISSLPSYRTSDTSVQPEQSVGVDGDDALITAGGLALANALKALPPLVMGPIAVPIEIIVAVATAIFGVFSRQSRKDEQTAQKEARESQERLANYYRWLNELRDQEVKIKAMYETNVNDFIRNYYEPKLKEIDQSLAQVDGRCAEHTQNLRAMESLLLRTGDELLSLSSSI